MKPSDYINKFKTQSEVGFTPQEIEKVLSDWPDVDQKAFDSALRGITCQEIDGVIRIYHEDVELALRCGLEKRGPRSHEWD